MCQTLSKVLLLVLALPLVSVLLLFTVLTCSVMPPSLAPSPWPFFQPMLSSMRKPNLLSSERSMYKSTVLANTCTAVSRHNVFHLPLLSPFVCVCVCMDHSFIVCVLDSLCFLWCACVKMYTSFSPASDSDLWLWVWPCINYMLYILAWNVYYKLLFIHNFISVYITLCVCVWLCVCERERERERERTQNFITRYYGENSKSNLKTLFYKDCICKTQQERERAMVYRLSIRSKHTKG